MKKVLIEKALLQQAYHALAEASVNTLTAQDLEPNQRKTMYDADLENLITLRQKLKPLIS